MPQMMPINWMMLFIFFICIYLMFNIMNYYIFNNKINLKNKMNNNNNYKYLYWKW